MLTVDQVRELRAQQESMGARAMPIPSRPAPFVPGVPQEVEEAEEFEPLPPSPAPEPAAPASEPEAAEEEPSDDHRAALEVDTTTRAKAAGLTLKDMRKARRSLRKLAEKLEKNERDEWEGIITAAVLSTPEIYGYIDAVTAYAAFAETKAKPALIEAVIAALTESDMVPPGTIPYNEEDFAKREAEKVAEAAAAAEEPAAEEPAADEGEEG